MFVGGFGWRGSLHVFAELVLEVVDVLVLVFAVPPDSAVDRSLVLVTALFSFLCPALRPPPLLLSLIHI